MPTLQPSLDLPSDLLGVAVRTLLIYLFLVALLRVAGKREIGQLSTTDLVLLLIISNGVQNAMVGSNTSVWAGFVTALVLVLADRVLRILRLRVPVTGRLLEGEPTVLVRDGKPIEAALRREEIANDDLEHAIRAHGVGEVADVSMAVLETDGTISVVPRGADSRGHARVRRRRRPNLPRT